MVLSTNFKTLLEVAGQGSFVRASHALGISAAAVSKQIKKLEEQLGFLLFHRTTRSVVLTESGKQLVDCLKRNRDETQHLLAQLSDKHGQPSGRLRINAPMGFGEKFLVSPPTEYAKMYPRVVLDVEFNDNKIHPIDDGFDVIIRIGRLVDSELIAKKLADFSIYLCASPSFLGQFGKITTAEKLSRLPAVVYSYALQQISYTAPDGKNGTVNLKPAIFANSLGMMLNATLEGVGFARLPAFACDQEIKDGKLVRLLPAYSIAPGVGLYALYPNREYLPMKVRTFVDLISNHFSRNPMM